MTKDELEIKRFELEQQIQVEELEIKKKELDLKIQEQKNKTVFTPLIISIVGGFITLLTGVILKYYDNFAITTLEDKKFQSTLLLKATEANNYEEFSNMLIAFQENGLLSMDSTKIRNFRKKRFLAVQQNNNFPSGQQQEQQQQQQMQQPFEIQSPQLVHLELDTVINSAHKFYWCIVAGGDANLEGAKFEQAKSKRKGFKNVGIWFRNNSYRTCIGEYWTYDDAVNELFDVKEKINNSAYVVRFDNWCSNSKYDPVNEFYICQ